MGGRPTAAPPQHATTSIQHPSPHAHRIARFVQRTHPVVRVPPRLELERADGVVDVLQRVDDAVRVVVGRVDAPLVPRVRVRDELDAVRHLYVRYGGGGGVLVSVLIGASPQAIHQPTPHMPHTHKWDETRSVASDLYFWVGSSPGRTC